MNPIAQVDFISRFTAYLKKQDGKGANMVLMNEIGRILVEDREHFIYILKYAGVAVPDEKFTPVTDVTLVNLFMNNVANNKKLILGAAFLIAHNNKISGFDGDQISPVYADAAKKCMTSYFCGPKQSSGMGMSNFEGDRESLYHDNQEAPREPKSYADDALGALTAGLGATSSIFNDLSKNKSTNAAANPVAIAAANQAAKNAILQGAAAAKTQQLVNAGKQTDAQIAAEASKKTKIIVLGVTSGILALGVVAFVIVKALKKKRASNN